MKVPTFCFIIEDFLSENQRTQKKCHSKSHFTIKMNSSALDKVRTKLKPTVARVTSADGKIHHESGGVVTDQDVEVNGPGYVVDMAPDLTLSQILPWLQKRPPDQCRSSSQNPWAQSQAPSSVRFFQPGFFPWRSLDRHRQTWGR